MSSCVRMGGYPRVTQALGTPPWASRFYNTIKNCILSHAEQAQAQGFRGFLEAHEGALWFGLVLGGAAFAVPRAWYNWRLTEHTAYAHALAESSFMVHYLRAHLATVQVCC